MREYQKYFRVTENGIYGFFEDYRFLSNFHVADVWFDGLMYPSTEHAFQAAKLENPEERTQFLGISCMDARRLGQKVQLRPNWEDMKGDVMAAVVFDKFYRHLDLRQKLLATGDKYLEETNHWKCLYWGVCCHTGQGKNTLGQILMRTRNFWK